MWSKAPEQLLKGPCGDPRGASIDESLLSSSLNSSLNNGNLNICNYIAHVIQLKAPEQLLMELEMRQYCHSTPQDIFNLFVHKQ